MRPAHHRSTGRQPLRLLLIALLWAWQAAAAQPIETELIVSGLRSTQGRLLVAAHADRSSFPSQWDRATTLLSLPVVAPAMTVTLKLPAPGRYALIVLHDEDGDGRMSKNLVGLPREGYTTGNNPATLEFPRFDRAQLDLRGPGRIALQLRYP